MSKLASAAIAVALAGVMALPAPASAAQFNRQDRFVAERCNSNWNLRGCNDWRRNHHKWNNNDYRRWYGSNRSSFGNVAAGIFGFAVGAAIVNGINNSNNDRGWSSHVARCEANYRSYNARTDMYLGFDGDYHRCNL